MRGQENDTKRKVRVAGFVKDFAKCSEEFRGLKNMIPIPSLEHGFLYFSFEGVVTDMGSLALKIFCESFQ